MVYKMYLVICLCFQFYIGATGANSVPMNASYFNLTIDPPRIDGLRENRVVTLRLNITHSCVSTSGKSFVLRTAVRDTFIADVSQNQNAIPTCNRYYSDNNEETRYNNITVEVRGKFLGRTTMDFFIVESLNTSFFSDGTIVVSDYAIGVVRERGASDDIFLVVITVFVVLLNIGFGCSVNLLVVKSILKVPIPVIVGACCQYILNPLVSLNPRYE